MKELRHIIHVWYVFSFLKKRTSFLFFSSLWNNQTVFILGISLPCFVTIHIPIFQCHSKNYLGNSSGSGKFQGHSGTVRHFRSYTSEPFLAIYFNFFQSGTVISKFQIGFPFEVPSLMHKVLKKLPFADYLKQAFYHSAFISLPCLRYEAIFRDPD